MILMKFKLDDEITKFFYEKNIHTFESRTAFDPLIDGSKSSEPNTKLNRLKSSICNRGCVKNWTKSAGSSLLVTLKQKSRKEKRLF